eukprot:825138-Pleurochrysis_carterae.AAC.2
MQHSAASSLLRTYLRGCRSDSDTEGERRTTTSTTEAFARQIHLHGQRSLLSIPLEQQIFCSRRVQS